LSRLVSLKVFLLASVAIATPCYPQTPPTQPAANAPKAQAGEEDILPQWRPRFSTSLAAVYSDNLFGTSNYRQSDRITALEASGDITREGERSQLRLYASGQISRYRDNPSEDTEDYTVGLEGGRQVGQASRLSGGVEYSRSHEDRTSPDAAQGLTPTSFDRLRVHGGGEAPLGDFGVLRGAGEVVEFDFADVEAADGAIIDSDTRDRRDYELGLRFERPGAGRRPFVQGVLDGREYKATPIGEPSRDSRGYSAMLGLRRDSPALDWEVMAGVQGREFEDGAFRDLRTFDVGALLTIRRPGLQADFSLDRSIDETTLFGASSVLRTGASLGLSASPAPGWSAGLGYGGQVQEYQGINRTDYVTQASLWGRRVILPRLALELGYQFNERNSDAAGGDYDENRFSVTLAASLERESRGEWPDAPAGWKPLSGFYLGAFAGEQSLITGVDGARGTGFNTSQFGGVGAVTAFVAGYDFRIGSMLLGVEAETAQGDAQWTHTGERVFGAHARTSQALDLRAGLILRDGNTVFARGGAVRTRFNSVYALHENFTDDRRRLNGMRFGLGAEAPAGPLGAFVRAEYLQAAYPDYDVQASLKLTDNFANSEQQFRIGFGLRPFAGPTPTPRPYDFSGPYVGGVIGRSVLVSANQGQRPDAGRSGEGFLLDATRAGDGPELGVLVGYGLAWRRLYVGAELEASFPTTNWNIERDPENRIYAVEKEASLAASVRAGVLVSPSALLYLRVGVVQARYDNNYASGDVSVGPEKWSRGELFGGGLEVAVAKNMRARIDYSSVRYKTYSVPYADLVDDFENEEHKAALGILYAF
jgi:hypothetical protein